MALKWGTVVVTTAVSWVKLALSICFFGVQAFVYAIIAEDKKPLFGSPRIVPVDDDFVVVCEFPRLIVAMGSLSLVSLLLTILIGHLAVFLYPYDTSTPTPPRALLRSTKLIVFFLVAELVSASALAMLLGATLTQARHVQYQFQKAPATCTTKTVGHFGGGALLALDSALMWFVCQLLALEARADYLHLHHPAPPLSHDHQHHQHGNKKMEQDVAAALDP